ncbi:MAG TPA: hypothetical protein DIC36_07410 [Gammaproteobacteria bacterium]|nr:hypothetical protein [Gammaproteobacteria bacterium]
MKCSTTWRSWLRYLTVAGLLSAPAAQAAIFFNWAVCPPDSSPRASYRWVTSLSPGAQTTIQATARNGETLTCVWITQALPITARATK